MNIKFNVRGVEEFQNYLKTVPRGALRVGLRTIGEWLIGTPQRGLKHYPTYKYITYKQAYGKPMPQKQVRYLFAVGILKRTAWGIGLKKYNRTHNTADGWKMKSLNNGYQMRIENQTKGAYYSMSDEGQARLNALGGWRKVMAVVNTNIKGAIRHAESKIGEWLRQKGK